MKTWLVCIIQFILWMCCTSFNICKPPEIDFGAIVKNKKNDYLVSDRIQYLCHPGYDLEGSGWTTCKEEGWIPPPKCFAPCSITKEQLDGKKLLLHGGQRHSQVVRHGHTMEFVCWRGFTILSPSIRMCMDGNLDLPSCEPSEPNCQQYYAMGRCNRLYCDNRNWTNTTSCIVICTPPEIDKGSFLPNKSKYKIEETIQVVCNQGYTLENRSKTFRCTKYSWLPYPKCIPKRCDYPHVENGALSWSNIYYSDVYFPKKMGDTINFKCNPGFLTKNKEHSYKITCTNTGWDPEPECFKQCIPLKFLPYGHAIYNYREIFIEGENMSYNCVEGYHPENMPPETTCTKKGWSPSPKCFSTAEGTKPYGKEAENKPQEHL